MHLYVIDKLKLKASQLKCEAFLYLDITLLLTFKLRDPRIEVILKSLLTFNYKIPQDSY